MTNVLPAITVGVLAVVLVVAAVGGIRWARRGGTAARLLANALLLGLGMGVVVDPPQQGVEQAEEKHDKSGGETGDPPMG